MKVSDIAVKLLQRRTSNKVAVVSIFGECNSGKSFLLNQLLKVPNAFETNKLTTLKKLMKSPQHHLPSTSHTKGLWVYAEPITIEKEGEIFDIFFIDSEGLLMASDRQIKVNDSFTSDIIGDR